MASWQEIEVSAPAFAASVRAAFDSGTHKTIATLRADGAPRISGIEAQFTDGELTFGSMAGSRKTNDLLRDARFALHSPSVDPRPGAESEWQGDAKISGRAVATQDLTGDQPGKEFRAEIDEVVRVRVGTPSDHLLIEIWRPGQELRSIKRC